MKKRKEKWKTVWVRFRVRDATHEKTYICKEIETEIDTCVLEIRVSTIPICWSSWAFKTLLLCCKNGTG